MIFMLHIHVMYRNSLVQNGSNPLISLRGYGNKLKGCWACQILAAEVASSFMQCKFLGSQFFISNMES